MAPEDDEDDDDENDNDSPRLTMAEQILTQGASAGNLLVSNGRSNPSDAGKAVAKAAGTNPQPAAQALVAAASIDTVTTSNVLVGAAKSVPFAAGKAVVEAPRIPGPPSNELLTADMVLESGKADAGATARSLAGKPMAGFHATPSRRITVLYSIIVYVIRFKAHHYIDNRRYENDGLGRIGVSSQTSSITTSVSLIG